MSEETLQIAEERIEVKGKRERYTQLNANFQRVSRRDKQTFLSDQCKEIKKNNRVENTRDVFKKIGGIKGTFYARMGMVKVRHSKKLTEAEDTKKR